MKKIFILSVISMGLFACKNKNHYTIEIGYKKMDASGADTSLTNKTISFDAASDSVAYLKGQKDFSDARAKQSDDNKGLPVKFIVRNDKGNVVLPPGSFKSQELEETLYPNQKPKVP